MPDEKIINLDVFKIADPPILMHPNEDTESLLELADSIKEQGLINPLTVRKDGDHYQLIAGYRRLKAAQRFGIAKLPARIMALTVSQALIACSTENIQRLEHDPVQEAHLYHRLREEHGLSDNDLAKKFGKSADYMKLRLGLIALPERVQDMVRSKRLTLGAAQALSKIEKPEEKERLAIEMSGNHMTVERANYFIEMYKQCRDEEPEALQDDIIQEALKEPTRPCIYCNEDKKLFEFIMKPMCTQCEKNFIYLIEKEKRENIKLK